MAWSLSTPADGDKVRAGDDKIREMKSDIEAALSVEHSFPVIGSNPVCYHNIPAGTTAARPAFGVAGRWYWNTTTGTIQRDSGTAWVDLTDAGIFPSGTVTFFASTTMPLGWTRSEAQDDRLLRVVNTAGGGTGGAWGSTIAAADFTHYQGGANSNQTATTPGIASSNAHAGLTTYIGQYGDSSYVTDTIKADLPISHSETIPHYHILGSDTFNHGHTVAATWKPNYWDVIMATKN